MKILSRASFQQLLLIIHQHLKNNYFTNSPFLFQEAKSEFFWFLKFSKRILRKLANKQTLVRAKTKQRKRGVAFFLRSHCAWECIKHVGVRGTEISLVGYRKWDSSTLRFHYWTLEALASRCNEMYWREFTPTLFNRSSLSILTAICFIYLFFFFLSLKSRRFHPLNVFLICPRNKRWMIFAYPFENVKIVFDVRTFAFLEVKREK